MLHCTDFRASCNYVGQCGILWESIIFLQSSFALSFANCLHVSQLLIFDLFFQGSGNFFHKLQKWLFCSLHYFHISRFRRSHFDGFYQCSHAYALALLKHHRVPVGLQIRVCKHACTHQGFHSDSHPGVPWWAHQVFRVCLFCQLSSMALKHPKLDQLKQHLG